MLNTIIMITYSLYGIYISTELCFLIYNEKTKKEEIECEIELTTL